jgi:hypothetical protein
LQDRFAEAETLARIAGIEKYLESDEIRSDVGADGTPSGGPSTG